MNHVGSDSQPHFVIRWYRSLLMICAIAAGLVFGTGWMIVQARFVVDSRQAVGEIIRVETSLVRGGLTYHPVFLFHDQIGEEVISRNVIFASRNSFKVGDPVDVLYDPGFPATNSLNRFSQLW